MGETKREREKGEGKSGGLMSAGRKSGGWKRFRKEGQGRKREGVWYE